MERLQSEQQYKQQVVDNQDLDSKVGIPLSISGPSHGIQAIHQLGQHEEETKVDQDLFLVPRKHSHQQVQHQQHQNHQQPQAVHLTRGNQQLSVIKENKVGVIEQRYKPCFTRKRPEMDDDHGINLKVPRMDVFSNNTYALQSRPDIRSLDKSRRVSAPGGLPSDYHFSSHSQSHQLQQSQLCLPHEPAPLQMIDLDDQITPPTSTSHLDQLGQPLLHQPSVPVQQSAGPVQLRRIDSAIVLARGPQTAGRHAQQTHDDVEPVLARERLTEGSRLVQLLQENTAVKPELEDPLIIEQCRKKKVIRKHPPSSTSQRHQPSFTSGTPPNPGIADESKESLEAEPVDHHRRYSIKNGFDLLKSLIPSLAQNPTLKISKAALLIKGAEHIQQVKSEREALDTEIGDMRSSVARLTEEIIRLQAQLPSQGSVSSSLPNRSSELGQMFDKHVYTATMQNWKYWVFSKLMCPLLESFDRTVSPNSWEDMVRTSSSWLDQHASLVILRPLMLEALKDLSIKTDILSEPHRMPQEALNSISQLNLKNKSRSSRHSTNQNQSH